MRAEIVSTGAEVVSGKIADTNAAFISSSLERVGIRVHFHQAVGDRRVDMRQALQVAVSRSEIVVVTGGLGPTRDDVTREAVAEVAGSRLCIHAPSLERLEAFYRRRGARLPETNRKQATLPEGADLLPNHQGTAPGFAVQIGESAVFALPGVPVEMKRMWAESALPMILKMFPPGEAVGCREVVVCGKPESQVDQAVRHRMAPDSNPGIGLTVDLGIVRLSVTAAGADREEVGGLLEEAVREIVAAFGDSVVSTSGESLPQVVIDLLRRRGMRVAIAESCTGGMATSELVSVAGASDVLVEGVVAYSNAAKSAELAVAEELIERHGAVSAEVAMAMAEGVRKASGAEAGVGITGIAGPGGGTEEKPVGLVYVAVDVEGDVTCREFRMHGDREMVRRRTATAALDSLRRRLISSAG